MKSLEDQVVLITGCSTGIGRALTHEFAERGHRVMATARRLESLDDLDHPRVETSKLDVTSAADIASATAACIEWTGRIDLLVNNAGYGLIGPAAEWDIEDLRNQFETNFIGLVATSQAVLPEMIRRGSGRIVNIGSVSATAAAPFGGAYSASKAAVHLFSDALRMEVAPFGISVITVQPGAVPTRFSIAAGQGIDRYRQSPLYRRVFDAIETRARFSTHASLPIEVFARRVVRAVTRARPPAVYRLGAGSRLLPALACLPTSLRDRVFSRRFGLERLRG